MPELLKQIDSLSHDELLHVIEAACARLQKDADEHLLSQQEKELLWARADEAMKNPFADRPWQEVISDLERANEKDERATR